MVVVVVLLRVDLGAAEGILGFVAWGASERPLTELETQFIPQANKNTDENNYKSQILTELFLGMHGYNMWFSPCCSVVKGVRVLLVSAMFMVLLVMEILVVTEIVSAVDILLLTDTGT